MMPHSPSLRAVCALCLLICQASFAQRYGFKHYGPDEGLTTAVNRLLQDRDGFLWVGTANGLYRYDGERFLRFGIADGLPALSITLMHQSVDGTLWVVTSRGLARMRHNRFERVITVLPEKPESLFGLDSNQKGRLYLGSTQGLLSGETSPPGEVRFQFVEGAPRVPVKGVYVESTGGVWFGCGSNLCHLADGRTEVFGPQDGLPADSWTAILRDRQGQLWVRGLQRLFVRPAGAAKFIANDAGLPQSSNVGVDIAMDLSGTVMVSTDLGLARWVKGKWDLIGSAQGLESDTVSSVLQDREGSIWIGLWGAGVARWLGSEEWTNWTKADGLGNNVVWAIRRQRAGAMFAGTDNGLVRIDERGKGPPMKWTTKNGLAGDKVKTIAAGADGALWIGVLPGGISRLDPVTGRIRNYGAESGLADLHVIALYVDSVNRLWVSTAGGLFRSSPLSGTVWFERQTPPMTEGHELYFRLIGDRSGRIWIGGMHGLFCWDRGQWTRFTTADGLQSNSVTHVTQTADGALWVGYREPVGLSRLTFTGGKPHVELYTRSSGLKSDYILFLGVDAAGALWVGTDNGVDVRRKGSWTHYGRDEGLVWDDCAGNAFLAEPDGTVWIGTLKGLSRYHPASYHAAPLKPRAVITAARFGEKALDPTAFMTIPFQDHSLFTSFAALTFRRERDVAFRYRLIGLDEDWTETRQREARYPSLPAGLYKFAVKARSADGGWSEKPAELSFRILPPWWQTWWFRGLMLAALTFAVRVIWRWRMQTLVSRQQGLEAAVVERTAELRNQNDVVERQKGEIEQLLKESQEISRFKSEFLANMSHEIRTPMNGVIGMTQLALATRLDDEQRDYVTTIQSSGSSLLGIINDILDFSKIEAGKLDLACEPFSLRDCLSDALRSIAVKAHEKNLELTWRAARDVPDRLLGDAGRLRQIVLNLVGNATKFTERGEIAVEVALEPGDSCRLRFSVRDTGIGIDPAKRAMIFDAFAQVDGSNTRKYGGTGLGLAICSQLVILMDGKIWVESGLDNGSTFYFTARFGVEPGAVCLPALPGELVALLVDDSETSRSVIGEVLGEWGILTRAAATSGAALSILEGDRVSFVIVDLVMPGEDTFELVRRIVETIPANRVVALTSIGHNQDYECLRELGIEWFVPKPVHPDELYGCASGIPPVIAASVPDIAGSTCSLRILLAEDNAVNQRVAQRMLEKMGHDVVLAANGRDAVQAAKQGEFDLILMDVQMPEMDGLEATLAIRQLRGENIPIIAMTARAMSGDREQCLSAGMDDYITKPIDAAVLARILEKFCPGKAQTGVLTTVRP